MIVLALDTCLAACSVAVVRDGRALSWRSKPTHRGHQEMLASMIGEVMSEAGLDFGAVDRVGVTAGPGSFTGLRVGLAFAKGLGMALSRPCVAVGALEALAEGVDPAGAIAAVIDAGRGRLYLQLFVEGRPLAGPAVVSTADAVARLAEAFPAGDMVLTGPAAQVLSDAAAGARLVTQASPDPRIVARLAALQPVTPPRPLYLRPPDATAKTA